MSSSCGSECGLSRATGLGDSGFADLMGFRVYGFHFVGGGIRSLTPIKPPIFIEHVIGTLNPKP